MYELNKFFYAKIFDVNGSTLLIAILGLNWCICALKRSHRAFTAHSDEYIHAMSTHVFS